MLHTLILSITVVFLSIGDVPESMKGLEQRTKSRKPQDRLEAYNEISKMNTAPASREVTSLLAKGLRDKELSVRTKVARMLTSRQHQETAIKALTNALDDVNKVLSKLSYDGPGYEEGMSYGSAVVSAVGAYPDDRCAQALIGFQKKNVKVLHGELNNALLAALAGFGTRDTVKAVISYLGIMEKYGDPSQGKHFHDLLVAVAERNEIDDIPDWGPNISATWTRWLKKHGKHLPKSLGKMKNKASGAKQRSR